MDRRIFLQLSTGTLAMASFEGSQLHAFGSPSTLHSKEMTASEFHSGRRFVTTDQGRIAYIDKGTGSGALFLHGFPLNSFQWRGVIPQLSKLRRCIAPDFLGLGYTEVAAGQSVAPEAQVAMLVQLLDKLSIPEVDIVANDSGGATAQVFVTRYPKRGCSLFLTNCDTQPGSPPPALQPVIKLARAGEFFDYGLRPRLGDEQVAR